MNTKKEKITILLPIYKPNINFLKETLRSIVDQTLEKYNYIKAQQESNNKKIIDLTKSKE